MAPVTAPLSPDSPFPPFFSGTRFGAMLDMLTDRCSTMCLLVNLALLYPRATLLFQLSMSLDVASHWLHLHRSAILGVWTGGRRRYMGRDETFSGYLQASREVSFLAVLC